MSRAEMTASSTAPLAHTLNKRTERDTRRNSGEIWWRILRLQDPRLSAKCLTACLAMMLVAMVPGRLLAQADCLACHGDKGIQNAAGHNISVDGDSFGKSIHGSMK